MLRDSISIRILEAVETHCKRGEICLAALAKRETCQMFYGEDPDEYIEQTDLHESRMLFIFGGAIVLLVIMGVVTAVKAVWPWLF